MLLLILDQIELFQHGDMIDLRFLVARVDIFQTSDYEKQRESTVISSEYIDVVQNSHRLTFAVTGEPA